MVVECAKPSITAEGLGIAPRGRNTFVAVLISLARKEVPFFPSRAAGTRKW